MIQCQNCGRVNNYGSNFCRFCGTKFLVRQVSNQDDSGSAPRQPYSWKTDEFQVADATRPQQQQRKTVNQVQPPPFQYPAFQPARPPMMPPQFQQPLAYAQNPRQNIAHGNNCPRCAGQFVKYERKISTTGWIVFSVLMVTIFPLFWIGLLIKEDVPVCQTCNFRLS